MMNIFPLVANLGSREAYANALSFGWLDGKSQFLPRNNRTAKAKLGVAVR
jgi:hypothetical protein